MSISKCFSLNKLSLNPHLKTYLAGKALVSEHVCQLLRLGAVISPAPPARGVFSLLSSCLYWLLVLLILTPTSGPVGNFYRSY